MTPKLVRGFVEPQRVRAWRASLDAVEDIGDVSEHSDVEPLDPFGDWEEYSIERLNHLALIANAFTFDLGRECVGFYRLQVEAEEGTVIEVSGAENLRDDRPWIYRKGTRYTYRHTCRKGVQTIMPFAWSGFRYMHVVVRGQLRGLTFQLAGCLERRAPLELVTDYESDERAAS